jgi:hypothetical protein
MKSIFKYKKRVISTTFEKIRFVLEEKDLVTLRISNNGNGILRCTIHDQRTCFTHCVATNTNDYLLTLNKGFLDIEGVQELKYKKTLKK